MHVMGRFLIRNAELILLTGVIAASSSHGAERAPVLITDAARKIHAEGFIFDGHNDLPWAIRTDFASSFDQADISRTVPKLHTDIPRLRQGNVGAQFWSVFVPATASEDGTAFAKTIEQIELVRAMVKAAIPTHV